MVKPHFTYSHNGNSFYNRIILERSSTRSNRTGDQRELTHPHLVRNNPSLINSHDTTLVRQQSSERCCLSTNLHTYCFIQNIPFIRGELFGRASLLHFTEFRKISLRHGSEETRNV